ncbi:MAG: polysaccharide pyruvyl transferase family protein [Elusimicrobiaceae bacterium]|nr:polysaccharide pyruvyl transferase family protein [Elusimicrobiaceae bacterium]
MVDGRIEVFEEKKNMVRQTDVGLLTWHYQGNVGSCLQAYALFHLIEHAGYSACFINYRPLSRAGLFKNAIKEVCASISSHFSFLLPRYFQVPAYCFQRKFLKQTSLYTTEQQLNSLKGQFKMYLCGSDQIWAPNVLDNTYLLSFAEDNAPKYSYGPSIGLPDIPAEKKPIYLYYLQRFNRITVREEQGAKLLRTLLNRPIESVLDPTFLIDSGHWQKLALLPQINTPFLFCYLLGNNSIHYQWIDKVAQKQHLPVICVSPYKLASKKGWTCFNNIGPREFLGYILQSTLVVTDSFHGMALSINLQKNFYVLERFIPQDPINQNSRIYNILDLLQLRERLLTAVPEKITSINYEKVNSLLQLQRKRCEQILESMLKEGTGRN